eukprot:c11417_g1_i2.p1 GENE.c11417_g1_i2~~c11417_g1_i2.p1  ORF type:complete len:434 (+),score=88.04 c11417_g1_i2:914-2215(+)
MKQFANDFVSVSSTCATYLRTGQCSIPECTLAHPKLCPQHPLSCSTVICPNGFLHQSQDAPRKLPSHLADANRSQRTLFEILSRVCDVTSPPRRPLLRVLAEFAKEKSDRIALLKLSAKTPQEGTQQYDLWAANRWELADVLDQYPSVQIPLEYLLELLPVLQPRRYSITTCPEVSPSTVAAAVTVVDVPRTGQQQYPFRGLCSNWLAEVSTLVEAGERVGVAGRIQKSLNFVPPASPSTPFIMVGFGTGVAPFVGFIAHHRDRTDDARCGPNRHGLALGTCFLNNAIAPAELQANHESDKAVVVGGGDAGGVGVGWLIQGCRSVDKDCLFRDYFTESLGSCGLARWDIAASRDGSDKVYAQNILKHNAAEFCAWMRNGATLYVCGDGMVIARDFHNSLVDAIGQQMGMTGEEASALTQEWMQQKRYIRDIWG